MWFKLYVGLSGGFGGATYYGTYEYDTEAEALKEAYNLAIEHYQSYEGCHGIMSWEDCREELIDSYYGENDDDEHPYLPSDEDVDMYYTEEMEGWLSYYVEPAEGPDDTDEY